MNEWLDRGIFATTWVAVMWVADFLTTNTGVMSYGAMMIGAVTLLVIGFFVEWRQRSND